MSYYMCNEISARPLVLNETHESAVDYAKQHVLKVWKVYEQAIRDLCK